MKVYTNFGMVSFRLIFHSVFPRFMALILLLFYSSFTSLTIKSAVKTTLKKRGLHEPYKGLIRSQRLNDAGFHFVQAIVH
jgi:hypothetical protein